MEMTLPTSGNIPVHSLDLSLSLNVLLLPIPTPQGCLKEGRNIRILKVTLGLWRWSPALKDFRGERERNFSGSQMQV